MAETQITKTTKIDSLLNKTTLLVTNKQSRSVLFLIISLLFILAINGFLPLIEGQAHYTAEAVDRTYSEYVEMNNENTNYRLTWLSEQSMTLYIYQYIFSHPELTEDEKMLVNVPDNFKVQVYTKYFYEYPFWYISTVTSLGSSIILFYSLFNFLITLSKDKYKRYIELISQVNEMTEKHLDPVTFEPWVHDVFNYNRKIQQHKTNVKYEIDKLERKTTYKIKKKLKPYFDALRSNIQKDSLLMELGKLKWNERRYLKKKEKLLSLLEDSYIQEYVIDGHVKYFKYIHPMYIYNGQSAEGLTVDSYSLIKSDANRISKDAGKKILWTLTNTLLFAVLFTMTAVSSYQQDPFWIVVNAVSKIAPLMLQIPFAIDYSNVFMDTQLVNNLITRRSIGLLYLAYMNKQIPKTLGGEIHA